jgi:hypothetical protein
MVILVNPVGYSSKIFAFKRGRKRLTLCMIKMVHGKGSNLTIYRPVAGEPRSKVCGQPSVVRRPMTPQGRLMLKRASASRSSGEWKDDDFDVLADGAVVGRIMKGAATPVRTPWLWTLIFGYHEDPHADARLRGDTRGRDGGVRQELAAGIMDCPP